jgi:hypothetical protein
MCASNIGCGWTLGVIVLAIVETVRAVGSQPERPAEAIALYIGAAAKWARIEFDVAHAHVPDSHAFAKPAARKADCLSIFKV